MATSLLCFCYLTRVGTVAALAGTMDPLKGRGRDARLYDV